MTENWNHLPIHTFYGGATIRHNTVIINAIPSRRATSLRRDFSIAKFPRRSEYEDMSSEVMSRMMAVTAIQRLMSDTERGNCICQPSIVWYQTSIFLVSGETLSLTITTFFPVVFARAQATALTKGHPMR